MVQYTDTTNYTSSKSCGSNGGNCVQIIKTGTSPYPGAGYSGSGENEECDPADIGIDNAKQTNKLCNLKKHTNYNDYYTNLNITCSDSCTISNGDKCARCGDGTLQSDSESCDGTKYKTNRYGSSPTATSGTEKSAGASFSASDGNKYYINVPGVYCFETKGGDGNYGQSGNNGCKGASVKGCYKLQAGDLITFRVGTKGSSRPYYSGGSDCDAFYGGGDGGGASWVYITRSGTNTLLMVAGGGGGSGYNDGSCGVGSSTTSATTAGVTGSNNCSDNWNSDGTAVNTSNFTTSSGAGGDGGYYYSTKKECGEKVCDSRYSCGGGGGGYTAGTKGNRDGGGGGGGSYLNTSFTSYYSTGSYSPVAGSTGITSPSGGSIKVSAVSAATCSSCNWTTSYSSCN